MDFPPSFRNFNCKGRKYDATASILQALCLHRSRDLHIDLITFVESLLELELFLKW